MILIKVSHSVYDVSIETKTIRNSLVEDEVPPATLCKLACQQEGNYRLSMLQGAFYLIVGKLSKPTYPEPSTAVAHCQFTSNLLIFDIQVLNKKGKDEQVYPKRKGKLYFTGWQIFLAAIAVILRNYRIPLKYVFPKHLNICVQSVMAFFKILVS